jgi:hypothetical protein
MENRLSAEDCRKLLDEDESISLNNGDLLKLRDGLYEVASVVVDAFAETETLAADFDVSTLNPKYGFLDFLREKGFTVEEPDDEPPSLDEWES